ncbi:DUF4190 domain-containing protein [Streptomyces sp. NPDC059881]|uniref:DUF4190 domain-containing protein n=1 Tax=Streptomyces sp. NPDC059881 TaxID=3346986 RepID=UPI00365FB666
MPYPAYGMPPRPATNGFAVASLITGIVCCLPPLGFVLGLIALAQIKKKGQDGRGLAIAGTALSVISTILMTVAFATGGAAAFWDGLRDAADESARSRSTLNLRTGQCFDTPHGVEDEKETASVAVVDCEKPHDGEVSGAFPLHKFDKWPGDPAIESEAETRCEDVNSAYALDWWAVPETAETYYYMPTRDSWRLGDRTVVCTFAATEAKLKSSVRSDRTTLDPAQLAYLESEQAIEETRWEEPEDLFEDDPDANRVWAAQMSLTLEEQARALRAADWPAAARKDALARAKEYDAARKHYDRATGALEEDEFWEGCGKAEEAFRQETEIAVRSALGLSTKPPAEPGDEGTGDPNPDPDAEETQPGEAV